MPGRSNRSGPTGESVAPNTPEPRRDSSFSPMTAAAALALLSFCLSEGATRVVGPSRPSEPPRDLPVHARPCCGPVPSRPSSEACGRSGLAGLPSRPSTLGRWLGAGALPSRPRTVRGWPLLPASVPLNGSLATKPRRGGWAGGATGAGGRELPLAEAVSRICASCTRRAISSSVMVVEEARSALAVGCPDRGALGAEVEACLPGASGARGGAPVAGLPCCGCCPFFFPRENNGRTMKTTKNSSPSRVSRSKLKLRLPHRPRGRCCRACWCPTGCSGAGSSP